MKWQSEKTIRGDHRQEEHKQAFLLERKADVRSSRRTALWRPSQMKEDKAVVTALQEDDYHLGFSFSCGTIWHTVQYAYI